MEATASLQIGIPFNAQNGAEMQAKAQRAIAERKAAKAQRDRDERIEALIRAGRAQDDASGFIARSIDSVRAQMEKILEQMEKTKDADSLAKQATALAKLEAIERNFTMRPSAGSMKPTSAKPTKRAQVLQPVFDEEAIEIATTTESPAVITPDANQSGS